MLRDSLSLFACRAGHSWRLLPTTRSCDFKRSCTWKEITWHSSFQNCVLAHYNLTRVPFCGAVLSERLLHVSAASHPTGSLTPLIGLTRWGHLSYITAAIFWKAVYLKEKYSIYSQSTHACFLVLTFPSTLLRGPENLFDCLLFL